MAVASHRNSAIAPAQARRLFKHGALARLGGWLLLFWLFACPASADNFHPLYTDTKAEAMGGAYIGLADDEYAVFLNPAGVAGQKNVQWALLNLDLETSSDTISTIENSASAFKKFDTASINSVMGDNLYARSTFTSVFQMPNFSLGMIVDEQIQLFPQNLALPQILVGYQSTYGIQAAYAVSLTGNNGRIRPGDPDFRVGIAPKILMRRGGYYNITPTELMDVDEGKSLLDDIVGNYGWGFGLDLGTQYVQQVNPTTTVSASVVYRDVGNTSFSSANAAPIDSNLGFGMGAKFNFGLSKISADYDYMNILQATDWRMRNHFGVSFSIPVISLYAGYNQTYFTYGTSFDVWLLKVTAASYGQSDGAFVNQDPMRDYVLSLSFKLDF